jgi:hypothetical protein
MNLQGNIAFTLNVQFIRSAATKSGRALKTVTPTHAVAAVLRAPAWPGVWRHWSRQQAALRLFVRVPIGHRVVHLSGGR